MISDNLFGSLELALRTHAQGMSGREQLEDIGRQYKQDNPAFLKWLLFINEEEQAEWEALSQQKQRAWAMEALSCAHEGLADSMSDAWVCS